MIELVVARMLDEASSAPTKDFLAFDDFAKVRYCDIIDIDQQ